MAETAQRLGLTYDWFRKIWRDLVEREGLPAPFLGRRWDADTLDAWIRQRSLPGQPSAIAAGPAPAGAGRARGLIEALRDS